MERGGATMPMVLAAADPVDGVRGVTMGTGGVGLGRRIEDTSTSTELPLGKDKLLPSARACGTASGKLTGATSLDASLRNCDLEGKGANLSQLSSASLPAGPSQMAVTANASSLVSRSAGTGALVLQSSTPVDAKLVCSSQSLRARSPLCSPSRSLASALASLAKTWDNSCARGGPPKELQTTARTTATVMALSLSSRIQRLGSL
mmetsp:Transcript_11775/g.24869  ORF Transcript_11775/g.24869 Transcript_11775/m.24869 type:complete len:205 (-) Transcript_11775:53-667(-)